MTETIINNELIHGSQNNPNETLAKFVVEALKKNGHIPQSKENEVLKKVVGGTATQQDWKLWVDIAQGQPGKDSGLA